MAKVTHAQLGGSHVKVVSWAEHCAELETALEKERLYNGQLAGFFARGTRATIVSANLPRRLQNGPMCGLEAARSVADWRRSTSSGPANVDEESSAALLAQAVTLGLTKQGEFFYASDLYTFCGQILSLAEEARLLAVAPHDDEQTVLRRLFMRQRPFVPFLVPYDAAPSGRPALLNGSKAHWCAVMALVMIDDATAAACSDAAGPEFCCDHRQGFGDDNDLFAAPVGVFILQSKSRRPQFCLLSDLLASCRNLQAVKHVDHSQFKVPPDGRLEQSLAHQIIHFKI